MSILNMAQRDACLYQVDHSGCVRLMDADITGARCYRQEQFLEN